MKKRTLFFLSVCAVALNGYVVHADSLEAPSQLVTVPNLPGTGGQLTVVEEAGQMKAILSNITGEIVGVTGQFKSETNTGKTIAFTIDASGQYVAYLDRTSFSNEDQAFTLALTANLIDGSAHNLDDYSFNWVKVAENTNDDSDLIENTNATEASKPVSSGTVVDSVEKDSSSSASETQSSSTASSSLAATVTDSSNVTSASTLTSTQTTSSVGSQLRSASLMRIAANSSAQSSAVTKASQIDQTLELKYTGSINSGEVIKFAVWSDEKGQDDIVWYNADQTGAAYADLRKHRDYGKYNIHTYVNRNGKMVYLNEIVVDVKASGTVTIENVNDAQGTFDVRVTNISSPKDIASVILPTWSRSDDLRWYGATRQSDGSYKLTVNKKDHQYRTGTYTVHLYYKDSSGGLTGVGGTTTRLTEVKPTGTMTIENVNDAKGTFDVRVTNISSPKDIASVILPTWSQSDDLRWYEATRQSDGSYKLTVNKKDHQYRTGTYTVHLYYKDSSGGLTGVGGTTTRLTEVKPTGTITIENVNDAKGTFDVRVTNISSPKDIVSIILPTWSQSDDLRWNEATRQSDGSYKLTVNKKDHQYRTGTYTVHLYYKDSSGGLTGVGGTTTRLTEVKPTGTITIENVNDAQGTFDVRVTNISSPKDIASVILPTWSQSDDLHWYEATRQSDGSYKLTVNKKDHQYRTGTYTVHLYYKDSSGGLTGAGGTTTLLSEDPVQRSYTVYIDPGHGGIDSGASYGGVYEKNLALSVANKLKANLIQLGYQVLMTRTADYNVDFKTERSKMANQSNADLFISIHFNATGLASSNATGIETYWYQYDPEYQPKINAAMHNDPTRLAESEILANQVQASLISGTGAVNRGVRRETFAVLRETAIPAILVELGFMDNPSDLQKIKQDSYQTKLANALAQGIDNWYGAVGGKPTSGTSTQRKSTEQSQMTTGQQSFFNNILPAIQQVSQKNSIVTSVMLAQSILESGWGTSQLAKNAYNIFGIKADSSWKGNTYTVQTKEVVNGKTITVEKQFRAYKSLLESISDYGSFFTSTAWRTKNYASFLQATNHETALTSLLASGYATDPAYAEKLKSLIQRYGLNQYDLN
ncbi:GBS Bsp-like repeat-containing protein [Streptococcus suis]